MSNKEVVGEGDVPPVLVSNSRYWKDSSLGFVNSESLTCRTKIVSVVILKTLGAIVN